MFVFLRSGCFVLVFIGSFLSEALGVLSARENREMLSAEYLLENLPLTQAVLEGNRHHFLQQWRFLDSQEKRTALDLKTTGGDGLLHLLVEKGRENPAMGTMTIEIINDIVAENGLYKNRPDKGLNVLYAENSSGKTIFDMATEPFKKALSIREQALFLRSKHWFRRQVLFSGGSAAGAAAVSFAAFKMGFIMGGGEEPLLGSVATAISVVGFSAMAVIQCREAFKTLHSLNQSTLKKI